MKGHWNKQLEPQRRCPEHIKPFPLTARFIPVAGDVSHLHEEAQRAHGYMMAFHAETGRAISKLELVNALGKYQQLGAGWGPWAYVLHCFPCEYLYDDSLIYEEPAAAEGAE